MRTPLRTAAALGLLLLAAPSASAAPARSPWGRSYFPDVPLVTHEGKPVRFYTDLIEGKHVVVSFVFTSCTKICGLMTANLARVQRALGERVGRDIHFYSITMDPKNDTPEVLARYARTFQAGPGWTFLTGRDEDIQLLRRKFGDLQPVEDHTANVNVGNDELGQWFATSAIDSPKYLAVVIGDWLDPRWKERKPARSYADAPPAPRRSEGATLYRTKCAACHTLGRGGGVGPDLAGVVPLRGEEWLTRWLLDPERMIAEKDPTALALLEKYGGVPMPNLALTRAEVAALIAYMSGR